jgi:hypothetical protein
VASIRVLAVSRRAARRSLPAVVAITRNPWTGEPESRRRVEATLAEAGMNAPMIVVSRSYLDRITAHNLALSLERAAPPPLGLLQVAEMLGGANWRPIDRIAWPVIPPFRPTIRRARGGRT